jgi:hypothetical protein
MGQGTRVLVLSGTYAGRSGVVVSGPVTRLGATTCEVRLDGLGFTLNLHTSDMVKVN